MPCKLEISVACFVAIVSMLAEEFGVCVRDENETGRVIILAR